MSQALYRKYRPQSFADVVDQNHIKVTLQNEILSGQLAHAYLFTGPHGVGKTTLARIIAKSINCENRSADSFEPCNKCDTCKNITAGRDLDIIEIDAATHTQVDKVRENIIENVKFTPHKNKYKVFIIDEVHMLSTAAFNALLKTLEEPPEYIVFILCTTEIFKLPETIVSRCQRFDFKKVTAQQTKEKLQKICRAEKINIQDEVLLNIALRAGGFMRDAESLLGQIVTLFSAHKKEITLKDVEPILPRTDFTALQNLVENLIQKKAGEAIQIINTLVDSGVDLERFNLDLIDYLRKMVVAQLNIGQVNAGLFNLSQENQAKVVAQAEKISLSEINNWLNKFLNIQNLIKESEISQLPLEMAIVELTNPGVQHETPASLKKEPPQTENAPLNKVAHIKVKSEKKEKDNEPTEKVADEKITYSKIDKQLTEIQQAWPRFIKEIQQVNHSLPLILQGGFPKKIENNLLEIGFAFEIHAQRMKEESCLASAEKILSDIMKTEIKIKPVLVSNEVLNELKAQIANDSKSVSNDSQQDEDHLKEILNSFGGKVIE